ncbi:UDP-glycosyltransferase 83A1-like [Salvia miltiorrhiza]|uniref:UDP-glycosyltransferase 83A1-like n=1 Tax=Salvia miltiorrhiza TaxID=226208 RepID=UPI0025AC1E06|nr:UDP-glycosyltransferase 83A1-like [Salvia miltiorrhiza]
MGRAHVVAIPYPAQGHVIPMMELAQCLAKNGVRVTFVNTESNHRRVVEALPMQMEELLDLVSVPDGLDCWEDRMDFAKSVEALGRVLPPELQALIQSINATQTDAVTCIVTDVFMAGITQAYESFRLIKRAAFLPAAAALLALTTSADKLVDDGIIDTNGTPLQSEPIRLSPSMPAVNPNHFAWLCLPDLASRKLIFQSVVDNNKSAKLADFLICNSSSALEPAALGFLGNCRPIGPLLGRQAGHFWPENPTCLSWLDRQPPSSVVYVAFGSFTLLDPVQFRELALGLELTGMPFLWVVRQDVGEAEGPYPDGFEERVRGRGKTVGWAPQQRVLAHPAVACFVTHCGWNSTVESISSGVPVLCWPYFADQFLNETYVVDEWGVGVRLERDGGGVIGREEIRRKVEVVLGDGGYKKRMVELQGKTLATSAEGGSSHANLCDFIDWIKEE